MGLRTKIRRGWRAMWSRVLRLNYEEDFVRVYPDDIGFDQHGKPRQVNELDRNNYLNHCKFYRFAAQFAAGKRIADIGCGAGYGCRMLLDAGAASVTGADASTAALTFARERFGDVVDFHLQDITSLKKFATGGYDVTVCSEVLEHIKEYGKTREAIAELKRITAPGGLVIVGTPNSELLGDHGFWFDEINADFAAEFKHYVIFENALEPFDDNRRMWHERQQAGRTGVVISQPINLDETVLVGNQREQARVKQGQPPGLTMLNGLSIDNSLLHNTHSWVVVAMRDPA